MNMSFYTQKSKVELVIHVNKLFFSVEIDPHVRYLNHSGTERINSFEVLSLSIGDHLCQNSAMRVL